MRNQLSTKIFPDLRSTFCPNMANFCKFFWRWRGCSPPAPCFLRRCLCLLVQLTHFVTATFLEVTIAYLDSGHLLHDIFQVREIRNSLTWGGGKGGIHSSHLFLPVLWHGLLARISVVFLIHFTAGNNIWQPRMKRLQKTCIARYPVVAAGFVSVASFDCCQNGFILCALDKVRLVLSL